MHYFAQPLIAHLWTCRTIATLEEDRKASVTDICVFNKSWHCKSAFDSVGDAAAASVTFCFLYMYVFVYELRKDCKYIATTLSRPRSPEQNHVKYSGHI